VDLQQIEKLLEGGLPKPKPPITTAAAGIPGQPQPHLQFDPQMYHHMQYGAMMGFGGAGPAQAAIHMVEFRRVHRARRRGGVIVAAQAMHMGMAMPMMPPLRNPPLPLPAMNLPPPAMPNAPNPAMVVEPRGNRKRARFNDNGR
jgi:hypothetical protein